MKNSVALIVAVLLLSGCGLTDAPETTQSVKYEVTGTATTVSITLSNSTEDTEQIASAKLPWSRPFTGKKGGFLYVSAQNQGSTGSVTARIIVNGSEFKTATSNGAYVIATASGSTN